MNKQVLRILEIYIDIDMETPYHFNPLIVIKVKVMKHRQLKLKRSKRNKREQRLKETTVHLER